MSPLDLLRLAHQQSGFGLARMILSIRRKRPPTTERIRIAGPGSPLGRVVGSTGDDRYQVDVSIADVEAWVEPMIREQSSWCVRQLTARGYLTHCSGPIAHPVFELQAKGEPVATMSLEDASRFALWLDPPTDAQENRSDST